MNNMKRMIWIGVTILVMIVIMGIGLHIMKKISLTNQERRQKDAGEAFVSQLILTTETTSVWDRLRATEAPETAPADGVPVAADGAESPTEAAAEDGDAPEYPEVGTPAEQTFTTAAIPVIVNE